MEKNETLTDVNNKCLNCGKILEENQEYCPECGMKRGAVRKIICSNCKTELNIGQKYCPVCGTKTDIKANDVISSLKYGYKKGIRKMNWKKVLKIFLIIIIIIAIIFVGKFVCSKIFVSAETLASQGDYTKAYEKSKTPEQKDRIYKENMIAVLCKEIVENYKDPSSFELRDAWFSESPKAIVMKTGGKNSYGGIVFSYNYFTYNEDEKKYELDCSVSDLQKEKIYNYLDSISEQTEKYARNFARLCISGIISNDDNKLANDAIANINNLYKSNLIDNVELLDINQDGNL